MLLGPISQMYHILWYTAQHYSHLEKNFNTEISKVITTVITTEINIKLTTLDIIQFITFTDNLSYRDIVFASLTSPVRWIHVLIYSKNLVDSMIFIYTCVITRLNIFHNKKIIGKSRIKKSIGTNFEARYSRFLE